MPDDPKRSRSIQALKSELHQMLEDGEASVVETEGGFVRRVEATKVGQTKKKSVRIKELNEFLEKNEFLEEGIKRVYRRKAELPDPSKPRWAAVNRASPPSKVEVKLRLDPKALELVDQAVAASKVNRTVWMTKALLDSLRQQGLEVPEELDPTTHDPN